MRFLDVHVIGRNNLALLVDDDADIRPRRGRTAQNIVNRFGAVADEFARRLVQNGRADLGRLSAEVTHQRQRVLTPLILPR